MPLAPGCRVTILWCKECSPGMPVAGFVPGGSGKLLRREGEGPEHGNARGGAVRGWPVAGSWIGWPVAGSRTWTSHPLPTTWMSILNCMVLALCSLPSEDRSSLEPTVLSVRQDTSDSFANSLCPPAPPAPVRDAGSPLRSGLFRISKPSAGIKKELLQLLPLAWDHAAG